MGRLSEYDEEEKVAILGGLQAELSVADSERFWADAELGRRVRELLASEESANELAYFLYEDTVAPSFLAQAHKALAWFREQLLGPAEAVPLPPPANIPEAGREPLWGNKELWERSFGTPGSTRILDLENALADAIAGIKTVQAGGCFNGHLLSKLEGVLKAGSGPLLGSLATGGATGEDDGR